MKPETKFKCKVLLHLKKKYPGSYYHKAADMFTSGIPDIEGCFNGRFVGIELKVWPNKATLIQLETIRRIKAAGGIAIVAYTIEEIDNALKEVVAGAEVHP